MTVFKNKSGPQAQRIKKDFQKIFRESDLNIGIKRNLKIVDYLDITLNLLNGTYQPFSKPNNEINYIHNNEKSFNESRPIYQEALKKSGYDYKLKYQKNTSTTNSKQQRKRNIIWFNPPYSMNAATNVGRFS